MPLPLRARVYLWLVAASAAGAFIAALLWLALASTSIPDGRQALVLGQLALLSIVSQHFKLSFGAQRKFDLSQAVHLAMVLLVGTALGVILAGIAELVGQLTYLLRRDPATRRRMIGCNGVIFNTSQVVLMVGAAGLARAAVMAATTGSGIHALGIDLDTLLGVIVAGAMLYLANTGLVAVMIALHSGRNPLKVWQEGRRWSLLPSTALMTLGALAAHTAAESPWVPVAMAIPAGLTYLSLKHTAEAEAAVRLRDEFLGIAAHELRTPITSLRGYAQLLVGQAEKGTQIDEAKLARSLRTIDRQSAKLCGLIDQLLDLSRLQSNQLALERETFDLADLAREVAAGLQPLTPGFALNVHADGSTPILADRLRLEQVLTNLVNNAARHAGKGERIDLEVAGGNGAAITLAVRDYGVGIAPEHRQRIFERFVQVGPEAKAGGLGIGLFITREIVELHGGTITVECPADGGSRFLISLPAPAAHAARVTPALAAAVG